MAKVVQDNLDTEFCPAERTEVCLNCNHGWLYHTGWRCKGITGGLTKKQDLIATHRYLTPDMHEDILITDALRKAEKLDAGRSEIPSLNPVAQDQKRELAFFATCRSANTCGKCGAPNPCNYHS